MSGYDPMDAVHRANAANMRESNRMAGELQRATLRTADATEKTVALLTEIARRLERLEARLDGQPSSPPESNPPARP